MTFRSYLHCLIALHSLLLVGTFVFATGSFSAPLESPAPCVVSGSPGLLGGAQGVLVNGVCRPALAGGFAHGPQTKTVFCGIPNGRWNPQCGQPLKCFTTDKASGKPVPTNAFATLTLVGGRWTKPVTWCPANARPALDVAALRDRAVRLLPKVQIGSAWTTTALVNAETVLWADTGAARDLGPVTVIGQRVQLRIAFARANWDFGDGSTDTVTTPGKAYDSTGDPCRTAQCADYYGHTYEATGPMTITLTVTWQAQYRAGNGAWTDIVGPITGPTTTHAITLKQARGVLIPNPGDH
jgi:hypothetical protein